MPSGLVRHLMAEEFSKKYIKSKPEKQRCALPADRRQRILMALTFSRRRGALLPDEASGQLDPASELENHAEHPTLT